MLHTLLILYLESNKFIGNAGAEAFARMLYKNHTLLELHLGENDIGVFGMEALAKVLLTNDTLTCLYLEDNDICDVGEEAFSKALCINTTLKSLKLDEDYNSLIKHYITSDFCLDIADSIKRNNAFWIKAC